SACSSGNSSASGGGAGNFPTTPGWRFVFINHVTTNSFFIPTRPALADAPRLPGTPTPQSTGHENTSATTIASANETAIKTSALKQNAPGVTVKSINTGAQQAAELNAMTAAFSGTPDAAGLYAVDAGSTAACANLITGRGLAGKIHAGGFDTLPDTIKGIQAGALDFSIDQSAYMQGFLTTLHLYLYRLSGTLLKPPQTDTGLTFVTKENVAPYVASSAYEGGTSHNVI